LVAAFFELIELIRFHIAKYLALAARPLHVNRIGPPDAIHWKRDFAEYDSTYDFKDGKLISARRLRTIKAEVSPKDREDYKQFVKALQDGYGAMISLTSGTNLSATPAYIGPPIPSSHDLGSQESAR
jgi:hypothetical protein